jgi:hypothetical protein
MRASPRTSSRTAKASNAAIAGSESVVPNPPQVDNDPVDGDTRITRHVASPHGDRHTRLAASRPDENGVPKLRLLTVVVVDHHRRLHQRRPAVSCVRHVNRFALHGVAVLPTLVEQVSLRPEEVKGALESESDLDVCVSPSTQVATTLGLSSSHSPVVSPKRLDIAPSFAALSGINDRRPRPTSVGTTQADGQSRGGTSPAPRRSDWSRLASSRPVHCRSRRRG